MGLQERVMGLQEHEFAAIAERLVADYGDHISFPNMISVLHECAGENPADPPELVEHAARVRLGIRRQGHTASP